MLRLRDLGLRGSLDALDFTALPSLTSLDLNGNNLAGAIPSNISRLRALASLDLSSNGFIGTIPPQLGDLSGLVELRQQPRRRHPISAEQAPKDRPARHGVQLPD
jgi:Leucine-rich repeat (LRR) protein